MPRRSQADLEAIRLVEAPPPVEIPPPPAHLSPAAVQWWTEVTGEYELKPHHLKLLEAAGDAWDRMTTARAAIIKDGITVAGPRGGIVRHPAIDVERDSRNAFLRCVRELDLDIEPPREDHPHWRPPPLRSNRRR